MKKELLLFAAAEVVVQQYSELLEECGLKPVVADLSSLAIYRLYNKLGLSTEEEHVMILQVDLYGVNISIFFEHKPVFIRYIVIPIEQENWAISVDEQKEKLWEYQENHDFYMQALEDVFKEIDRVLNFYKYNIQNNQHEVSKMVITGDHPFLSAMIERLKSRFEMPVFDLNSSNNEPSYNLSIGLALRGGK